MKTTRFMLMISLLLVISSCSLSPKKNAVLKPPLVKPVEQSFTVEKVKRGTIAKELKNSASFESYNKQDLFYKSSGGRLKGILVKSGDNVKKGDVLAQLDTDDYERRIFVQQRMLEKQTILYQQNVQLHPENSIALDLQKIDIDQARNELSHLNDQLLNTKLIAPFDGVVTFVSDLTEGDYVVAYNIVVSISNPHDLMLVSEFPIPSDLANVNVGMNVDIIAKEIAYKGHVLQAPSSVPKNANMAQLEFNNTHLIIGVDGLPDVELIGSYADIVITLDKKVDTLVIPDDALNTYLGRNYVNVLDGKNRKEIDVETGIVTKNEVEITKGLEEGQQVIIK
jgi:RND family efflux transporter MFP subunit